VQYFVFVSGKRVGSFTMKCVSDPFWTSMEQEGLFKVESTSFTVHSFAPVVEGENAFCDQILTVDELWLHSFDMKLKLQPVISL
jgi:hypothetical protein